MLNKKEKKRLRLSYLKKIDNAIIQEKSRKKQEPNLDYLNLLHKLKNIIKPTNYEIFYMIYSKKLLPDTLGYRSYYSWFGATTLDDKLENLFNDDLIQREIAFKILDI